VSRYDGNEVITFTTEDGLAHNGVGTMLEDQDGNLWFATRSGVSCYDGSGFSTITPEVMKLMLVDREGNLWSSSYGWYFGEGGDVIRYDGEHFIPFTTRDNAAFDNEIRDIFQDRKGHLWICTWGAGIIRYDGFVIQNMLKPDGLAHNAVHAIIEDQEGDFWIATEGGVTRYRPALTPPSVRMTSVTTDRRHGPIAEVHLPVTQDYLLFEFQGASLQTRPDAMVYMYRLLGHEAEWQQTRNNEVEYIDLPIGEYIFQVKAVDVDLNYSEKPAELKVIVHLPYPQIAFTGVLGFALMGLVVISAYALRRRRDLRRAERALMQELEEELQTAHDMQMGLMPKESPKVSGFDISGRCLPANHVGGDFFQYFQKDGKLAVCMADVTGHAMEAAIPVVMFNGILESQMELGGSLEDLFPRLNRSLYRTRVNSRTFVCFTMGELDPTTRTLCLSNSGCPYPFHYHTATGQVTELQVDAYPLGVRADTVYSTIEMQLEPGDCIIFCSDGIAEAANAQEQIFGFEQTAETIRQACAENLSAEVLIDRLIGTVKDFAGDAPQGDDMTCVVLKVEA